MEFRYIHSIDDLLKRANESILKYEIQRAKKPRTNDVGETALHVLVAITKAPLDRINEVPVKWIYNEKDWEYVNDIMSKQEDGK